jgi:hypothetical protein
LNVPGRLNCGRSGCGCDARTSRRRRAHRLGPRRNYGSNRLALGNWPHGSDDCRVAVIRGCELLAVLRRGALLLHLRRHRRNALLVRRGHFRGRRLAGHTARPMITGASNGGVIDNRIFYGTAIFVYAYIANVIRGPVVIEAVSVPVTALITGANISVPVVHPAVVPDMSPPRPLVIPVSVPGVGPISRRPQKARFRRLHPRAWNPVISLRCVVPISRRPQIPISRTVRLGIFR